MKKKNVPDLTSQTILPDDLRMPIGLHQNMSDISIGLTKSVNDCTYMQNISVKS